MKDDKKVPQLRFPEFTDAWKQRKFSEVFEEYSEKKHPELPALTIIQGKGTILRDASDRNLLYDKANLASYKLVRKDDFIVHLRTFEGGLEKANSDGIVSPAYHIFHGKNTDTRFFYPFFRSKYFIDALLKPHVYGIRDGKSIDIEGMKTISFLVPSFEEQNKIGKFVETLDNTITLQQRKLNSLQKLKKGLLQKMFPKNGENIPEIRFPEFSDAWKQCKLSDLVNVIDGDRGKNYPTEADFEPHGHTLFLNASNVTIDGFLFDTNQFITEEKSNSMGSGKIIKDDIIITSRGSLGHIAWYNDSVQQVMPHLRINSGMLILRNKANVKTSYLHQFMKSDKGKAQIVFMSFGSAQPQLTKKGVESFTVNYPMDTEEQIKIGAFFSKLDNTITLQQRKLESLQKLKKGLLQQMFI